MFGPFFPETQSRLCVGGESEVKQGRCMHETEVCVCVREKDVYVCEPDGVCVCACLCTRVSAWARGREPLSPGLCTPGRWLEGVGVAWEGLRAGSGEEGGVAH